MFIMPISAAVTQAPLAFRRAYQTIEQQGRDRFLDMETSLALAAELAACGFSNQARWVLKTVDNNDKGPASDEELAVFNAQVESLDRLREESEKAVHQAFDDWKRRPAIFWAERLASQAMHAFSISNWELSVLWLKVSIRPDALDHLPDAFQAVWKAEALDTIKKLGTWRDVVAGRVDLDTVIKQWHPHLDHSAAR